MLRGLFKWRYVCLQGSLLVLLGIGLNLVLIPTAVAWAQDPSTFDEHKVYLKLQPNSLNCILGSTINPTYDDTLRSFISYSLPYEWHAESDLEAYKAGAIAIRTFALNPRHYEPHSVNAQMYRCVYAYQMQGFTLEPKLTPNYYPRALQAISETNGIYITHPQAKMVEDYINPPPDLHSEGAIDAQFRAETGQVTLNSEDPYDFQYLQAVADPISPSLPSDLGMGQNGSSRLAVGLSIFTDTNLARNFPSLTYLQVLNHYYTGIHLVQDDGMMDKVI